MSIESSLEIRPYRDDDLATLQSITTEAFGPVSIDRNMESEFGAVSGHDWKWRKARAIADDCGRDPAGVFVAVLGDQIVGYITSWSDREAGIGFIPNLAVDQKVRGQGIGRKLIQRALDHFRDQGLMVARIETLEQNPVGQQLYPSLGFREVARQIHYGMRLDQDP